MDNFVVAIKNNIEKNFQDKTSCVNNSRYRNLISLIVNNPSPKILIENISLGGDIRFYVTTKELGVNFEILSQYKTEIFSDFMANFIGELVIRENLDEFSKILTSIKTDDYHKLVNQFDHYQFGLEFLRDKFIFTFHVSLIQNILTESFKRKIKNGWQTKSLYSW